MDEDKRRKQVLIGVLVMAVGTLLILNQTLGWARLEPSRLWPIILIVIGVNKLIGDLWGRRRRCWSGLTTILLGVLFLLSTERVMDLKQSWPGFIVIAGVGMMISRGCEHEDEEAGHER